MRKFACLKNVTLDALKAFGKRLKLRLWSTGRMARCYAGQCDRVIFGLCAHPIRVLSAQLDETIVKRLFKWNLHQEPGLMHPGLLSFTCFASHVLHVSHVARVCDMSPLLALMFSHHVTFS